MMERIETLLSAGMALAFVVALWTEAFLAVQGVHGLGDFGEGALEVDVGGVHFAGSHC
jgi:hypothetical protein